MLLWLGLGLLLLGLLLGEGEGEGLLELLLSALMIPLMRPLRTGLSFARVAGSRVCALEDAGSGVPDAGGVEMPWAWDSGLGIGAARRAEGMRVRRRERARYIGRCGCW